MRGYENDRGRVGHRPEPGAANRVNPKASETAFFSNVLRKLVQERKLTRQKVAGQFLYCAADRNRKAQQLSARRALLAAPGLLGPVPDAGLMPEELRAAIVLFASLLDERQRRVYARLESLKCGWGGDTKAEQLQQVRRYELPLRLVGSGAAGVSDEAAHGDVLRNR